MARMSGSVSVAANSTSANQLAGLLHEFIERPSAVRVLAAAAATGVNATLLVGGKAIINDNLISFANRFPIAPDDEVTAIGALPGERLILTFRNTTGAAIVVNWAVDVEPVA